MTESYQTKPLSPSGYQIRSHEDVKEDGEEISILQSKNAHQKRRRAICIGCCGASTVILAVLITVLMLTVFRVKDPEIVMNRIRISPFSLTALPSKIKIIVDVAVKNRNVASFRYRNSTTFVYYHGNIVGRAHTPPGLAKARRTQAMNLSIEIGTKHIMDDPKFFNDILSGLITLSSYTRLDGRVRVIFKRNVVMKMNCTFTANITSQILVEQKCKEKVSL